MPPEALTDIYALAAYLARTGAMAEPKLWFAPRDHVAAVVGIPDTPSILTDDKRGINPKFQGAPLAYAVALLPGIAKLPGKTPVMWTRGLRPDGTWGEDGPYGTLGGQIAFADGSVRFFREKINDMLETWASQRATSNILEALPPGTRISEYVPSPEVMARVRENDALVLRHERWVNFWLFWLPPGTLLFTCACGAAVAWTRWGRARWEGLVVAGGLSAAIFLLLAAQRQ